MASGTVSVAWLDPGEVKSDFCNSISDLFRMRAQIIAGRINVRSGGAITRGRNRAVAQFVDQSPDEWMLWVDSDMEFTVADFDLIFNAAHPKKRPIIGGLCFGQDNTPIGPFPSLIPTVFDSHPQGGYLPRFDYEKNQLIECDATGSAFVLIHRSVFEKIRADVGMGSWSWYMEHPQLEVDNWTGEDVAFCELAKASGFPIHVHTGAKIGHTKGLGYTLTEEMYWLLRGAVQRPAA